MSRKDVLRHSLLAFALLGVAFVLISCTRGSEGRAKQGDLNTEAEKSRWVIIDAVDSTTAYYDKRSVVPLDSTTYRVWLKVTYSRSQGPAGETEGKRYTRVLIHNDFDCALRRVRFIEGMYYDSSNVRVGKKTLSGEWQDIIPDTRGERMMDRVCKDVGRVRQ